MWYQPEMSSVVLTTSVKGPSLVNKYLSLILTFSLFSILLISKGKRILAMNRDTNGALNILYLMRAMFFADQVRPNSYTKQD